MSTKKNILVCVTPQESSLCLIKSAKTLANEHNVRLEVISVLSENNSQSTQVLEKLYEITKDIDADMIVYFNDEPIFTVAAHIATHKPEILVTGFPADNSNDFVATIHEILPALPISMIDKEGLVYNMLPMELNKFLMKTK